MLHNHASAKYIHLKLFDNLCIPIILIYFFRLLNLSVVGTESVSMLLYKPLKYYFLSTEIISMLSIKLLKLSVCYPLSY